MANQERTAQQDIDPVERGKQLAASSHGLVGDGARRPSRARRPLQQLELQETGAPSGGPAALRACSWLPVRRDFSGLSV